MIVVAGVAAVALVAAAATTARGAAHEARGFFAGSINIGYINDLSGVYQTIGFPAYNGTQVAVNKINNAGGVLIGGKHYNFKLVTCEADSSSAQAVACAQQLVRDKHINFIMGASGPASLPTASITDAAGAIYFNPGTALAQQLDKFKRAFNPLAGINLKVRLAAKGLVRSFPGAKRVAFVTANDPTAAVMPLLIQELEKYGITVVAKEVYDVGALDVTAQLTKAKAAKPDLMFVGWTQAEAAPVIRANQTIQVASRIYGWTGGGSCELFKPQIGPAQFVSDLLIAQDLASPTTPAAKAYVAAYKKFVTTSPAAAKNPVNIQNIAYSSFYVEALPLLAKAIEKVGSSTNLSKIASALLTTSIPGLSGTYKLAPDRSAVIAQAHCSVNVKGPGVISSYAIKP
jgi:branched-chain amino acid transport system substrate-binding protein